MNSQYELFLDEVKRAAADSNLKNLREVSLHDSDRETRIWAGFGLTYARCFVVTNTGGNLHALFLAPKLKDDRPNVAGHVVIHRKTLDTPKSGWDEFDAFLRRQEIYSPAKFSLDKTYSPTPDNTYLVLESKSGDSYGMTFFPTSTKSNDGLRLIQTCQRIEQEFNIEIGCR